MEIASLTAAVVGAVELVNRAYDKDWRAVAKIVIAGLVGALLAPQVAMTWFAGLLLGLGASGVVTAASKLGGK